jgi:hypothetical protein
MGMIAGSDARNPVLVGSSGATNVVPKHVVSAVPAGLDCRPLQLPGTVGFIPHWRKGNGVFVTFGDSGSRKQNCHERGEGGELENPCESTEKRAIFSR